MKTKIPILALALFLTVAGVALANDGVELPRWVLSGGASDSAGGGVALRATLGQSLVGVVTNGGGDVTLGQGFWHGAGAWFRIHLPVILR